MATLIFKMDDTLRSIIKHAAAAKKHGKDFAENLSKRKAAPGLFLVHDDGVYLMSKGIPAQLRADCKQGETKCVVAYAQGCNPVKDKDCWDTSRAMVGGDDFGESLDLAIFVKAMERNVPDVRIKVSATQLEILA